MLLAIDVGNTSTQFGVFDGNVLRANWRLATHGNGTADEMGLRSLSLLEREEIAAEHISDIVVASVVPPLTGALTRMSQRYFGVEPLLVSADLVDDLPILYDPPGDVGADRIVNAIAARQKYGVPSVVVDFGTATTFDVINGEGAYLGGVIATGVGVSAEALFARAARLPRVDVVRPQHVIGRSTVDSVRSGLFYGYADLVDGLLRRIIQELGGGPTVIATGGWAVRVGEACELIEHVDLLLTLEGLNIMHTRYAND